MQRRWERDPDDVPGRCLPDAARVKAAVSVPVIVTGGFQRASLIARALEDGSCDAVSIARGLIANNDLVELFRAGHDLAPRPCTYCNKCLYNVLENPLGCYDERRFGSREEMVEEIMSVYAPAA
jgi:2,4-dienoyl-CoA reductase-like NADH-dependent reductase (Old Yellow Enzyme family)